MMSEHRYPPKELVGDYVRAALGVAATGGPLLFVPASPVMMWVLGGLAALFLAFGARTALRQTTVVRVDDAGITAIGPLGVSIAWSELGRLGLAYYSTRRDRSRGWMQLSVRGSGRSLRVDSTIDGFREIVAIAADHAEQRRLDLSPATIGNLVAMGIQSIPTEAEAAAADGDRPRRAGQG
jgi:hypothetical protein